MNIQLIAGYTLVAAVMACALVGFAHADGVDAPESSIQTLTPTPDAMPGCPKKRPRHDPNYWQDFDNHPCCYELGHNPACRAITPGFATPVTPEAPRESVPEPEPLALMGIAALAGVLIRRRNGNPR